MNVENIVNLVFETAIRRGLVEAEVSARHVHLSAAACVVHTQCRRRPFPLSAAEAATVGEYTHQRLPPPRLATYSA